MTTMKHGVMGLGVGFVLVVGALPAMALEGAPAVFAAKCMGCHSLGGERGEKADVGGSLDDATSKHDGPWLQGFIADPKSKNHDSKMPQIKLTPEEVDSIVTYMMLR
jgi:mono/diheme cytochrome c family protein